MLHLSIFKIAHVIVKSQRIDEEGTSVIIKEAEWKMNNDEKQKESGKK